MNHFKKFDLQSALFSYTDFLEWLCCVNIVVTRVYITISIKYSRTRLRQLQLHVKEKDLVMEMLAWFPG